MKRFPPILFIWLACSLAWAFLGSSLVARTGEATGRLMKEVHLLWGRPLEQGHPTATYDVPVERTVQTLREVAPGRQEKVEEVRVEWSPVGLPLEGSALAVGLDLTHRRKGLLWFPTYAVDFRGRYTFENPTQEPRMVTLRFPLAGESAVYDGFVVTGPRGERLDASVIGDAARWTARFEPHERRTFDVRYRSRGTTSWNYRLTEGAGQVKAFALALDADVPNVDFAPGSISPTTQERRAGRWHGEWRFEHLVASAPIGLVLPNRMNPGPLASRITFFAPVGLLFFFFVVGIVSHTTGRPLHPMHYFFIGCAFFAFHLLFAYLVDHVAILPSFLLASVTSIALVVSYARLFTGWGFAIRVLGLAQMVFLVLFSVSFFWEGFTGLAITVGAVLTLTVMMQYTGRTDWERGAPAAASTTA